MEKKFFLAVAIVALLMLMCFQVVFTNVGKSDPLEHTGDAYIGNLWISELDCSSFMSEVDNVGIAHANATNDWVYWPNRVGNITANWTINIAGDHPEYYIIYMMMIYSINSTYSIKEVGNASYSITIGNNISSRRSGTLKIVANFSSLPNSTQEIALVGWISAYVKINNTIYDAKNFTSVGNDRCVVAVDFQYSTIEPPFSWYQDIANVALPHLWTYAPGWDEQSRFADEDDMLNNQTAFLIENEQNNAEQVNSPWDIGTIYILNDPSNPLFPRLAPIPWEPNDFVVQWEPNTKYNGFVSGNAEIHYNIYPPIYGSVRLRVRFWATEYQGNPSHKWISPIKWWTYNWFQDPNHDGLGSFYVPIDVPNNNQYKGDDEFINVDGSIFLFDKIFIPMGWVYLHDYTDESGLSYRIQVVDEANQDYNNSDIIYWQNSVTYLNHTSSSFTVDSSTQSGITTVHVYIANVLQSENECVYTYSAERGNMRVQILG